MSLDVFVIGFLFDFINLATSSHLEDKTYSKILRQLESLLIIYLRIKIYNYF
jgi:hypothetical protein